MLSLLRPDQIFESVLDISPRWLTHRGVRGIIIDLDNTTIPWGEWEFRRELHDWIHSLQRENIKICILSNGRLQRVATLAQKLAVPYIHGGRKPRKRAFAKALELLKTEVGSTAVIGDQLFTDVLGGNRAGMLTILVTPLSKREFIGTKLMRCLEKVIFKQIK